MADAWSSRCRKPGFKTRDGAPSVLKASQSRFPFVKTAFADSVYAGKKVAAATSIVVEIVRKLPDQVGFQVLPRRWVVERFFALINRNRRLAKDFEATIASATAFLYAACVMLLTRRLARCVEFKSDSLGSRQKTINHAFGRPVTFALNPHT